MIFMPHMHDRKRYLLAALALVAFVCGPAKAFAACASPAGNAGDVFYSSTSAVMVYCNGTNWIAMGSSAAVSYGTLTTNDFCVATSGTAVSCTTVPTGTGNVVLSASPTLTGTLAGANSTWTGQVAVGTTTLSGAMNVSGTITATGFSGSGASLTAIPITGLSATGTANSGTFLRGDGTWAAAGNGSVTSSAAGQVAYYAATGSTVIGTTTMYISGGQVGIGTATPLATLTVNGTAAFMLGTDYTSTGTQSDVAINTASTIRYNGGGVATFYGIVAGTNGQIIHLHNASSSTLTLSNQSASESTAANKIITGSGSDLAMSSNSSVILQYDTSASRWRVIGGSGGTPGGSTTQVQFNNSGSFGGNANLTWDNTNYRLGVGTATPLVGLDLSQKTDAVRLPSGTTGSRPATPVNGDLRYNSTIPALEAYVNSAWVSVGAGGGQLLGSYSNGLAAGASALSNCQITFTATANAASSGWNTSGCNLNLPSNTAYIVVEAWGAGGGGSAYTANGSGGGTTYFCTSNSSCTSTSNATFYATGGGGAVNSSGEDGGSGGVGTSGDVNLTGQQGQQGAYNIGYAGGSGGAAARGGGGGRGGGGNNVGQAGAAYGGGGGGYANTSTYWNGSGGGGGGYASKFISGPSGTYYYTIGAGGAGGATGGGGGGGITVTAYSSGSTQAFNIATQATGTLPVVNGGTGLATLTSNVLYKGNGTSALAASSLTDNGTYLTTTENVGIGTTAPTSIETGVGSMFLDVTGNNPTVKLHDSNSSGKEVGIANLDSGLYIDSVGAATASNNAIFFRSNNTNSSYNTGLITAMTILSSGNVGIGVTSPGALLDIEGSTSSSAEKTLLIDGNISFNVLGSNPAGVNKGLFWKSAGSTGGDTGYGYIYREQSTGKLYLGSQGAGTIIETANGGYVGIGNTSPTAVLTVTGTNGTRGFRVNDSSNVHYMSAYPDGAGNIYFQSETTYCTLPASSTSWSCPSDMRLKENVRALLDGSGLATIGKLRPVTFDMIRDDKHAPQIGFIAQEVQKVLPELVSQSSVKTDLTPDGTLTLNQTGLIAPIVKAVQELKSLFDGDHGELEKLKADNAAKAVEIKAMTARIDALEAATHH